MGEKKDVSELLVAVLEIERQAREVTQRLPEHIRTRMTMALNGELDRLLGMMRGSVNSFRRLCELGDCIEAVNVSVDQVATAPPGTRLVYLDTHGFPTQRQYYRELGLSKGAQYTLQYITVGASATMLHLKEFAGVSFNSVCFDLARG